MEAARWEWTDALATDARRCAGCGHLEAAHLGGGRRVGPPARSASRRQRGEGFIDRAGRRSGPEPAIGRPVDRPGPRAVDDAEAQLGRAWWQLGDGGPAAGRPRTGSAPAASGTPGARSERGAVGRGSSARAGLFEVEYPAYQRREEIYPSELHITFQEGCLLMVSNTIPLRFPANDSEDTVTVTAFAMFDQETGGFPVKTRPMGADVDIPPDLDAVAHRGELKIELHPQQDGL